MNAAVAQGAAADGGVAGAVAGGLQAVPPPAPLQYIYPTDALADQHQFPRAAEYPPMANLVVPLFTIGNGTLVLNKNKIFWGPLDAPTPLSALQMVETSLSS
jgi:hypothetical protein